MFYPAYCTDSNEISLVRTHSYLTPWAVTCIQTCLFKGTMLSTPACNFLLYLKVVLTSIAFYHITLYQSFKGAAFKQSSGAYFTAVPSRTPSMPSSPSSGEAPRKTDWELDAMDPAIHTKNILN